MSENLHDIDHLFRDSIEDHAEMPSGKVWDAIDNNLDKTNIIQIKRRYNNFKRIAIILILLLSATVIYQLKTKTTSSNEGLVNTPVEYKNEAGQHYNTDVETTTVDKNTAIDKAAGAEQEMAADKEVTNAAKDDATNATREQTEKSVSSKVLIEKKINVTGKNLNNTFSKNETVKNAAAANETAQVTNNTRSKKSTVQRTKMVVKNGRAVEMEEDKELTAQDDITAAANELAAMEKIKAVKISRSTTNLEAVKIDSRRLSPETAVVNNTSADKKEKSGRGFHFNVLPFYAPQYSYTRIEDNHSNQGPLPPPGNGRQEIKNTETQEKATSFGILVEVPITKKWRIQSGITYLAKTITIESKKIFAKMDNDGKVKYRFDCSSGYTYLSAKTGTTPTVGDSVRAIASINKLQYIGVPLAVSYKFSAGKFDIMPTAGGGINFLAKQKIETELLQGAFKEKQSTREIHGLKSTYYNALAAVAVDYRLSKRIALNLTPTASFALSSINKDAAVKSYPNSIGVAAGVKIKF